MKNLFKVSLFAIGLVLSLGAHAATGTGHAQAELTKPLTITNSRNVDFGTVSIDPSAEPQVVSIDLNSIVTCPATYVCSGTPLVGRFFITGAPSILVSLSLEGSIAVLSDGAGYTLSFDPAFWNETDVLTIGMDGTGFRIVNIQGALSFSGNEPGGTYNTMNAGGSGYEITVIY